MPLTYHQQLTAVIESDDPARIEEFIRAEPTRLTDYTESDPAIIVAAASGKLRAVECLYRLGVDLNVRGGLLNTTALEEAVHAGHLQIVRFLTLNGAVFDTRQPDRNPYFAAMHENQVDAVRLLLDIGIDPHVVYRTIRGGLRNALAYAREMERTEIAELLTAAGCQMPVDGVAIPINEDQFQGMRVKATPEEKSSDSAENQLPNDVQESAIVLYVSDRFGPADELALREILPVLEDVHVAVHVIRPTERHPFWTLFTTGMSSRAMNVPAGQEPYRFGELLMHFPPSWPHPRDVPKEDTSALWPIQVMRQLAHLPHINQTWYGACHTASLADPPEPLGPNTQLSSVLLIADKLRSIELTVTKSVKFFTLLPIYNEELALANRSGMDALLHRLQQYGVTPLVDVQRINVGLLQQ